MTALLTLVILYRSQAAQSASNPPTQNATPTGNSAPAAPAPPDPNAPWNQLRPNEEEAALKAKSVDRYLPSMPEKESFRNFEGQNTGTAASGVHSYRHADHSGWFSYEMKVDPSATNDLIMTYWGGDNGGGGARSFDILIDDHKIASETLDNKKPDHFVDVTYPIPSSLTSGKHKVRIKIKATGAFAGGVWDCWILRH